MCLPKIGIRIERTKEWENHFDEFEIDKIKVSIYYFDKLFYKYNIMAMSEFEEKYRKLFDHETKLVSGMDDLALKLHINELEDIARESRTRLTAAAGEAQKRKNSVRKILPALDGSLDSSSQFLATEAISNIEARAKKQNKQEKQIENMMSLLGMSREDAERMFSGSKILEIKNKPKEVKVTAEIEVKAEPTAVGQNSSESRINREPSNAQVEILDTNEKVDKSVAETLEKKSTFKSPFSKS